MKTIRWGIINNTGRIWHWTIDRTRKEAITNACIRTMAIHALTRKSAWARLKRTHKLRVTKILLTEVKNA